MKTTIAVLLAAGACGWGQLAVAQAGQAAAPPPVTAGATNGANPQATPAAAPAAIEERFPIVLRLPPLGVIEALAETAGLDVEVDARIRSGLDATNGPIPNWTEPVTKQWENKTVREALEDFLAGYKQVLVAQPGTKKLLITYPEAAAKPPVAEAVAPPAVAPEPMERVLDLISLDDSVPEAIRTVATKGKMNISIDPAVMVACQPLGKGPDNKEMPSLTNKVVETWQNISVRGALEAILAPRGLMLVQYSNSNCSGRRSGLAAAGAEGRPARAEVPAQGHEVSSTGTKGLPRKTRRKAASALRPCLRAVDT